MDMQLNMSCCSFKDEQKGRLELYLPLVQETLKSAKDFAIAIGQKVLRQPRDGWQYKSCDKNIDSCNITALHL